MTRSFDPERLETIRPWLVEHVCPFWCERITDPAGGFFHELDANGAPVHNGERATLVQARLTYVLSHAYLLNKSPSFRQAAEHGMNFLCRACAAPDGGWYRLVSTDGEVIDPTRDCYDQAFGLFALAWYFRATGDAEAIRIAERGFAFLQKHLADPRHGGFFEQYPGTDKLPRRQNPHMHLLEALLALHAATGDQVWLARAGELVRLFASRFCDPRTGALIEFFAADWSPAQGAEALWREPGHQFEWVWLLFEYFRLSGDRSVVARAQQLFELGLRFGLDPEDGAVFDALDADGHLLADTKLLWPQTEFLKAWVARWEFLDDPRAAPALRRHLALIARHFLQPDGASWHNQIARDCTPRSITTPARVLYHLMLAMAEVDRVNGLRAAEK